VVEREVEVEALGCGLEECHRNRHGFLADAVTGQNDDPHGEVLRLATEPDDQAFFW
jgi:hypothetical protein